MTPNLYCGTFKMFHRITEWSYSSLTSLNNVIHIVYFVCFILFVETLHRKCVFHLKQPYVIVHEREWRWQWAFLNLHNISCTVWEFRRAPPPSQTQRLALVNRTCSGRINWNFWCVKHERQHVIFALKWTVWSVFLKELEWDDNLLCGEHHEAQ